jgi:hypothetical protein
MSCDRQKRHDANGEVIPLPYFPDIIIMVMMMMMMMMMMMIIIIIIIIITGSTQPREYN